MSSKMNQLRKIGGVARLKLANASNSTEIANIASQLGVHLSDAEIHSFSGTGIRQLEMSELEGISGGMASTRDCFTWPNGAKSWGF